MVRIIGTGDQASAERSGLSPNPSPPGHRRTVTRNQISYQLMTAMGGAEPGPPSWHPPSADLACGIGNGYATRRERNFKEQEDEK